MLSDYQALVDNLVRDDSGSIAVADRDRAIGLAVIRYSTDRPQPAIEAVVSAGGVFVALPPAWQSDFSRLSAVKIPLGDDVCPIAGEVEQTLTGFTIRLERSIAAGTSAHVHYTVAHVVTALADSIPLKDREAVADWAAALVLDQLASLYSGQRQPTINADTVDWQSKGRDYGARANALRKLYFDHLGIDPKRTVPAGAVVNLQMGDSRGRDRIVHSQRRR